MKPVEKLKDHSMINKKHFIDASDNEVKNIVTKILNKTKYINHMQFINYLYKSVKKLIEFLDKHKISNVYVYKTKNFEIKSNKWIFDYVRYMFKHLKSKITFKLISSDKSDLKKLKNNDIVLFPDDCIYSGSQMRNNIRDFMESYDNLYKEGNKTNKNLIYLYILSPFISSSGIHLMKINIEKNQKLNYKLIICKHISIDKYLINKYLTVDEIRKMESYYPNISLDKIKKLSEDRYLSDFSGIFLIYFNHKLADFASTITLFYMGVVPNKHNKKILKSRKPTDVPKLQIIPLINNCDYTKLKINVHKPICPKPPYK